MTMGPGPHGVRKQAFGGRCLGGKRSGLSLTTLIVYRVVPR